MRTFYFMSMLLMWGCNSQNLNESESISQTDSVYLVDTVSYVFPKIPFDIYDSIIARKVPASDSLKPRNWYHFDENAIVNGCANIFLQKISADHQYELLIDLTFGNLPKSEWIDVQKYLKFVKIIFNKYRKGNKFVEPVCNDYLPASPKPLIKYVAVTGRMNIVLWSEKESTVWVMFKDVVLQDSSKNEFHLPFEFFEQIKVHWVGG